LIIRFVYVIVRLFC